MLSVQVRIHQTTSAVALISPQLFFACLTIYILCQILLRHKQAFRCVFERASPCLVSFPSPESNKGPSIRGQAAVIASLQCRLVPGQAGGAGYTYCGAGHETPPLPPFPHQYSPSCVGHRSPCHVLLLLRLHSPCDRWKENERQRRDRTRLVYSLSDLNVGDRPRLWIFVFSFFYFCVFLYLVSPCAQCFFNYQMPLI